MPRNSKKRSAEEAVVEDGDDDLLSPPKRVGVDQGGEDGEDGEDENQEEVENEEMADEEPKSPDGREEEEGDSKNNNDQGNDEIMGIPKRINQAGRPAEAGVIKTIYVENFMCHPKLTVNLCRNVNFIHGQNGSGKSAILAAIQICLGSNARRTHRARNLKDLVRKEAAGNNPNTSAKVRVTLLNGGEDGYKQDVYGQEISVERCISLRGGYNGFKLYDEEMKEVSRNKKHLEDMLDHLNIQVDNPVAILGQEDAKQFLKGKASDKYAFFLKATELERIDHKFCEIADRADELQVKQEKLSDSMARKLEVVETLRKKLREFKSVDNLEKQKLGFQVDYGWALFAERDEEYKDAVEKMEKFQQKVEEKQLELTQAEEAASGGNDTDEEKRIRDRMKELESEAESAATLKRDLEAEVKLKQLPLTKLERNIKSLEVKKKDAAKNLTRAKKLLKDTRDEIMAKAGSAESEEARRNALLIETEAALAREKDASDSVKEAVSLAYQQYEEIGPEVEQATHNASSKAKEVNAVRRKLKDLQASSGNDSLAIFGPNCSKIHQMVEEARRKGQFQGDVIGPVGAFIKIAPGKEKYAALAETALGNGTLDRWIVTCTNDRKVMEKLRRQAGCKKDCGLFQVHVSPRFKVPAAPADDIETVASVLSISNDIVFNCLVDNSRIDQRALAPSKEVSEQRLLKTDANGRYSIKGIINEVSFLPKGDKWVVRDGTITMSSNDRRSNERKIGVDRSSAIEDSKRELQQLEKELVELRAAEEEVKGRHNKLKRDWNLKQRAKRENEDSIATLTRKKEEIELERESSASDSIDTTELEEDVAKCEEELEKLKEQESSMRKEKAELEPAVEEAKSRRDETQARNDRIIDEMRQEEENLEKCVNRLSQQSDALQRKRDKMSKYQEILAAHKNKVDACEEERSKALLAAKRLTLELMDKQERDEAETDGITQHPKTFTEDEIAAVEIRSVEKDSKNYEAKINRLSQKILKERERKKVTDGNFADVQAKYSQAFQDLGETQAAVKNTKKIIESLMSDMKARRKRHAQLKDYLAKMSNEKFDEMLKLNGASGELEFDDHKNELNLVVQKDKNTNSQTKDVQALSGGERSFTTISLLLALGECLESPFRVLDEFDVFLDTQVRRLTIQILVHIAKTKLVHRQFIFITPQDLSSVTPDDKLKIFKLKPPERTLVAGGPTQQTLDFSQSEP